MDMDMGAVKIRAQLELFPSGPSETDVALALVLLQLLVLGTRVRRCWMA